MSRVSNCTCVLLDLQHIEATCLSIRPDDQATACVTQDIDVEPQAATCDRLRVVSL